MFRSVKVLQVVLLLSLFAIPRVGRTASTAAVCADDAVAPPDSAPGASPSKTAQSRVVGTDAPDFSLKDPAGKVVHLRDFRGKVVVIDFWASECPSSRAEMPYLQQMHDQYSEKDLAILGLNIGEDAHQVSEFATDSVYTFPLLVGADPDVLSKYLVTVYPVTFVIDRGGKIIFAGSPAYDPGAILRSVKSAIAKKN